LSALLTLFSISALVTAYLAITQIPIILEEFPEAPQWVLWGKLGLSVLNVVFLGAVWGWRRWGVFGLFGSSVTIFVINGFAGFSWSQSAVGLVFVLALILVIRFNRLWQYLR